MEEWLVDETLRFIPLSGGIDVAALGAGLRRWASPSATRPTRRPM